MIYGQITPQMREWIRRDYMGGLSLLQVGQKYHWLKKRDIRDSLVGVVRGKHRSPVDPTEEEIVERREAIKASWTPEQARLRWVGRYLAKPEYLGSCLSKALRDIGGEG